MSGALPVGRACPTVRALNLDIGGTDDKAERWLGLGRIGHVVRVAVWEGRTS
jgi:hypothetical protein